MTFASGGGYRSSSENEDGFSSTVPSGVRPSLCDCDDCGRGRGGGGGGKPTGADLMPPDIWNAIQRTKRQRLENGPLRRTQDRTLLIRRSIDNISIWSLTLPLHAEPLVEFGSSHRLILVKRLPQESCFKSIGTGIIGSSAEEQSRHVLDWAQGSVYFVPSNGGKAVGWVHTRKLPLAPSPEADSSEVALMPNVASPIEQPIGPAILYTIKIPVQSLPEESIHLETNDNMEEPSSWVNIALSLCQKGLKQAKGEIYGLPAEDAEKLKRQVKAVEDSLFKNSNTKQQEGNLHSPSPSLQAIMDRTEDRSASLDALLKIPNNDGTDLTTLLRHLDDSQSLLKNIADA